MGVQTETTWMLHCDRCPREQLVSFDPMERDLDNGWQWWTRRGVEGMWGSAQRLLCPDCVVRLTFFLDGLESAAGQVFNRDEAQRTHDAHQAQIGHDEMQRSAPWT